ncbi:bifunctional diguanylate cyclase/phosphodiesterase [Roseibium sp. MMSF_3544]|uniref:bifunctional diguanylate cyclase/phosphodiesterase n=1 Tax=unclassified Roseibium TaxID=2629323 RepID=UPI002740110F|nr:bifunctional diguanylate cyclase/phosphodiesterase [Roseibium sp. MMSF_3544]
MQIGQRLERDRREKPGRAESNTLTAFHASLLEVLPFAAAYIARDGGILLHNTQFVAACEHHGIGSVPADLKSLLSTESWKRCELVLSAAFNGLPAEVSGAVSLSSGDTFCQHMACASHVFLKQESEAVLVQFETGEVDANAAARHTLADANLSGRQRTRLDVGVLEHFPDDILVFEAAETVESIAVRLLDSVGSSYDAGHLVERLNEIVGNLPQVLHVPETRSKDLGLNLVRQTTCEIRLVPMAGETGAGSIMAIIRRNVDSPYEIAENRRLAYQDPLTGLENRRAFTRSLRRELDRMSSDQNAGLAVYYIDLDEFKKVNDLGGHDAGDDMLLRVAACLTLTLGEFGTVARIGGDEFAAMMPVNSEAAALEFAEKILEGFAGIRLEIKDRVFTISGSVGVAFLDQSIALKDTDAATLLGLADHACLRGKRIGGRSIQLHGVKAEDCPSVGGETQSVPEPESFCGKELTLYSMPIVSLRSGEVCGAEILLRLQGDRAKGMSSRAWISAAERSGFIAQVDAWTLDRVLDAAERQATRSLLTMNVSAESARDPNFRDSLHHRLSVNPLLASKLCLEIAEKDFLREPATVESFFRFVRDFGCQTAIDDFAGHWPVLSRLTGMRVEWLKLESGLTQQVIHDPAKAAILNGLLSAARDLGIKVIAKHIETPVEAELLRSLDIEAAQGFHFGRPAPWSDVRS